MEDLTANFSLERAYPGPVHLVRYEDLSMQPGVTAGRIKKFLNLPWSDAMSGYIDTQTYGEKTTYSINHKGRSVKKIKMLTETHQPLHLPG